MWRTRLLLGATGAKDHLSLWIQVLSREHIRVLEPTNYYSAVPLDKSPVSIAKIAGFADLTPFERARSRRSILRFDSNMMRERKGHRKLRLCSKKHYEKKKYFPKTLPVSIPRRTVCILKVSLPINLVSFRVSLPLSAYSDSPVKSVDILHNRMIHLRTVPQGK